jgi:hypothetical protein
MTMPTAPDPPAPDITPGRQGSAARPQADFGAPINIASQGQDEDIGTVGDNPEPTQHGGYVPPLFAMGDDDGQPKPVDTPPPRALTERISQGRPSYSEPDPHIAGVVGRTAPDNGGFDA